MSVWLTPELEPFYGGTYFPPENRWGHPGFGSILTQIALAQRLGLDWLYLGLAIRDNHSMAYKMAFMPHERRIDGTWRRFARG